MQTDIDPRDLIGHKAVDRNGDKIGTVDEVYLDDATGRPEWAAVRTGVFGRDAFVPLKASEFSDHQLRVPYEKSLIKDSPDFGAGQHLSPAQEFQLYRYYGLQTPGSHTADTGATPTADHEFHTVPTDGPAPDGRAATAAGPAPAGTTRLIQESHNPEAAHHEAAHHEAAATVHRATESRERHEEVSARQPLITEEHAVPIASAPANGSAAPRFAETPTPIQESHVSRASQFSPSAPERDRVSDARSSQLDVVCREERLEISTEWHVVGTARLRKYVVTEEVERRIPIVRERVRVERVPISDTERASLTDHDITEAVEEVTLREERPVVRKRLVPIERVQLIVEHVTHEEVVRTQLRREKVKVHDGSADGSDRPDLSALSTGPQVIQYNGSGHGAPLERPVG